MPTLPTGDSSPPQSLDVRGAAAGRSDLTGPPYDPLRAHVREVGWAILLINAIILLLGVMVALKTRPGALWFFVALAALSTVFIGGVLLLNLLAVWLHGGWVRRASARHRRL